MPICKLTGEEFEVTEQEHDLLERMGLRMPLFSPRAREIMRMAFRNDRNLFMRKCDATGESILSICRPDAPYKIYKYDYWISDEWAVPSLEYDPNKDFFDQYGQLQRLVPRVNLFTIYNENCDFCNAAEKSRNCYMYIMSDRCEDCYYATAIFASRDCIDCAYLIESELCYECTDCRNCYHCIGCFLCDNSSEMAFCFDCRGCTNCFGCEGLRNQQYVFFGEQLSKEQYEERMKGIDLGSYEQFSNYWERFLSKVAGFNYSRMINNENSDGNFLINTKNCHQCYDIEYAQDCFYVRVGSNHIKDVHHTYAVVDGSELIVGNVSTTESYNCHNVIGCWTTRDTCYSEFLQGCSNCFGCISLKRKQYCILNKQYSEEEYKRIRDEIIEKMGDYYGSPFPLRLAPFSYLDSCYSDYYEMGREEVFALGWRFGEEKKAVEGQFSSAIDLADNITDVKVDFSGVYRDFESGEPFKIISSEVKLLKKIGVPLPRKHFDKRFKERVKFRQDVERM